MGDPRIAPLGAVGTIESAQNVPPPTLLNPRTSGTPRGQAVTRASVATVVRLANARRHFPTSFPTDGTRIVKSTQAPVSKTGMGGYFHRGYESPRSPLSGRKSHICWSNGPCQMYWVDQARSAVTLCAVPPRVLAHGVRCLVLPNGARRNVAAWRRLCAAKSARVCEGKECVPGRRGG
jgi:hypothetical protein